MQFEGHRYLKKQRLLWGLVILSVTLACVIIQNRTNVQSKTTNIEELKHKAETGDADAQNNLGLAYYNGFGVNRDPGKAIKWWRRAVDQNHPDAQFNLGIMYYNGFGVKKDPTEAALWWRKAAELEHPDAQFNLGLAYGNGVGVEQDPKEAVKWFRKAADQGLASAQYALGVMYGNGFGTVQNSSEAVRWYREAAEQGYKKAEDKLKEMGIPLKEVRVKEKKEVRVEDIMPSRAVSRKLSSKPFLTIRRVKLNPSKVLAGSEFKMITEYMVHEQKEKGGKVSVKYGYRILKREKLIFEKKDKPLKKCIAGTTCVIIEGMTASTKRGTYDIVVTLTYQGRVAEKKVSFRIE